MNNQEKINFRQARDFGETFNVSVKFLRQNLKLFFQSLIYIAGPFVLISAIAGAFYQSSALSMLSIARMGQSNLFSQFGWTYLIFILATIVANMLLLATVFSFMINYMEKGPGGFTVNDVGRTVIKNIGNIFSVFFLLLLLAIVAVALVFGIVFGIASAAPVLGVLFGIALFFGLLILLPSLMWQLSVVYLVKMKEDGSALNALGRTRQVMRGNFWWTWIIMVCAVMAVGLISFIFALPQAVYQIVLMFSHLKDASNDVSIPFLIVASVCTFCSTLLYSGLYVISAFHYFSLAEQKDNIGLMERIDEIGKTPNNNVEQHY
ncbi:MAG: hypothetical protein Q8L90_02040 [Bacteroidota bacterium]|nr:hypothetical protein [Bacteroidota bacterium]